MEESCRIPGWHGIIFSLILVFSYSRFSILKQALPDSALTKIWKIILSKVDVAFYGAPVIYYRGGFVYFGGLIGPGNSVNHIKRLDAVTHTWSQLGYLKCNII